MLSLYWSLRFLLLMRKLRYVASSTYLCQTYFSWKHHLSLMPQPMENTGIYKFQLSTISLPDYLFICLLITINIQQDTRLRGITVVLIYRGIEMSRGQWLRWLKLGSLDGTCSTNKKTNCVLPSSVNVFALCDVSITHTKWSHMIGEVTWTGQGLFHGSCHACVLFGLCFVIISDAN